MSFGSKLSLFCMRERMATSAAMLSSKLSSIQRLLLRQSTGSAAITAAIATATGAVASKSGVECIGASNRGDKLGDTTSIWRVDRSASVGRPIWRMPAIEDQLLAYARGRRRGMSDDDDDDDYGIPHEKGEDDDEWDDHDDEAWDDDDNDYEDDNEDEDKGRKNVRRRCKF